MHMQLMNSYRIPFTTLMSYIPVIATIVTTFFSVILARATLRYVEATDKGLALAREASGAVTRICTSRWNASPRPKLGSSSLIWRRLLYCCNFCNCASFRMPPPSSAAG